jgi:hypothetical protein
VTDIGDLRVEIVVLGARLDVKVAGHSAGERVRVIGRVRVRVKESNCGGNYACMRDSVEEIVCECMSECVSESAFG